MRVTGAVLAAGGGSRMGRPKAELVVGGVRLLDRAVAALAGAGCASVLAVVRDGTQVAHARTVVNPAPERGMRSSLELAVAACEPDAAALALVLVDAPGIDAAAIADVIRAWRPGRITAGRYRGGRRGHPIVMAPELWREAIASAGPDEGARRLLAARAELVDEVEVVGDPIDLDTPEDLERWQQR